MTDAIPDVTARFTPEAGERFREYLAHARAALAGCDEFSPDDVEQDIRAHIAAEFPAGVSSDWPSFYAERRLLPLAGGSRAIEAVCERIDDLAGPAEAPARLHGDLWGGNVHGAYLVDPAAYGGHREVDLAMLRLFGSPGPHFLAAYEERHPLAPGHEERVALYQLYFLLVHVAILGAGYHAQTDRCLRAVLRG